MELHGGPADGSRETIPDAIAGAVVGRAPDERMLALDLPKVGKVIRQPFVVGVKKREPFAVGGGDGCVPRRGGPRFSLWRMTRAPSDSATAAVSSVELSSTTMTSRAYAGAGPTRWPGTGEVGARGCERVSPRTQAVPSTLRLTHASPGSDPRRSQTPLKLSRSPNGKLGYRSGPCHTIARPPPSPGWRG